MRITLPNDTQKIHRESYFCCKTFHQSIQIRLGASTRYYVLRDKALGEKAAASSGIDLPEEEDELDNLTEYNTARNKKITQITIDDQNHKPIIGRKRKSVKFNNEEDVINPEDVDDSIGKFRNSCEVTIIPTKVLKLLHGIFQYKKFSDKGKGRQLRRT